MTEEATPFSRRSNATALIPPTGDKIHQKSSRITPELIREVHIAVREFGATNEQLSKLLEIPVRTLEDWTRWGREHIVQGLERSAYAQYCIAIKSGLDEFNSDVAEKSLLRKVKGESWTETREEIVTVRVRDLISAGIEAPVESKPNDVITMGTKIVKTSKKTMPDTTALIFWLLNRAANRWKNVTRVEHDVSGNVDHRHLHGFVGGVPAAAHELDITALSDDEIDNLSKILEKAGGVRVPAEALKLLAHKDIDIEAEEVDGEDDRG